MIFCFIDESENKVTPDYYLILTGVLVSSQHLFELSFEIKDLKDELQIRNLKELRDTKRFKRKNKLDATKSLTERLEKHDVTVIGIVEFPKKLKRYDPEYRKKQLYYDAIWLLAERVTMYAKRRGEKWLFIADMLKYNEIKEKIRSEMRLTGEAFNVKMKDYLFETPFFVEDEFCNFVQVADLVALSLNHALRSYLKEKVCLADMDIEDLYKFSPYLSLYWSLFDRSPEQKVGGWGIKIWWYNE